MLLLQQFIRRGRMGADIVDKEHNPIVHTQLRLLPPLLHSRNEDILRNLREEVACRASRALPVNRSVGNVKARISHVRRRRISASPSSDPPVVVSAFFPQRMSGRPPTPHVTAAHGPVARGLQWRIFCFARLRVVT